MADLRPSEFEGEGPRKSTVFDREHDAHLSAAEKLRIIRRTEQDPDGVFDPDAPTDRFNRGGINSTEDITQ